MCPTAVEIKGRRHYEVGEEDYVSVTTVINTILQPFAGVPASTLREHADIGTTSHHLIAQLARGYAIPPAEWWEYDQRVRNSVIAYDRFKTETHLHPLHVEVEVAHHEYKYAGRIDQISRIPSLGTGPFDWKSGQLLPEAFFQLAAYYKAFISNYPKFKVDFAFAVHLDKHTGRPHPFLLEPSQLDYFFEGFLGLLGVYRQLEELNLILKQGERWKPNH